MKSVIKKSMALLLFLNSSTQVFSQTDDYELETSDECQSLVGRKAPTFTAQAVIDGTVKRISLDDYRDMYKVLLFYPADFSYICPTELHALQDAIEEFKKRNVALFAISVDQTYTHIAWLKLSKNKGGINGIQYPLIADVTKDISQAYGVLNDQGVDLRAVFILDKDDVVQSIMINNLAIGRNIDEVIRIVDALQLTEGKAEFCPANWQRGQKLIKPTREGLEDHFAGLQDREPKQESQVSGSEGGESQTEKQPVSS